jgi:hypothetical protein
MNGLFARIVARVLPKTPVCRWRIQESEIQLQVGSLMPQVKKAQSPVGRWSIETCDKKINARIDRSNEDHCGPCGRDKIQ